MVHVKAMSMDDDIRDFFGVTPVIPVHERLPVVARANDPERHKVWLAQFNLENVHRDDEFDARFPCTTALDVLLMVEKLGRFFVERAEDGKLTIYFQNEYD